MSCWKTTHVSDSVAHSVKVFSLATELGAGLLSRKSSPVTYKCTHGTVCFCGMHPNRNTMQHQTLLRRIFLGKEIGTRNFRGCSE